MSEGQAAAPARRRLIFLIPLLIFAALAAIFLIRLETEGDISAIPSALVGKPVPEFDLPGLDGGPGLKRTDLIGKVTVVNVFASWCGPCRVEHPQLAALAADPRIRVVGINYKDVAENARRFLGQLGNPFAAIGVDGRGRAAIDWGVYGVPETFVVDKSGIIRSKFIGPMSPDDIEKSIKPAIESALGG